jgi:hypothetical protein
MKIETEANVKSSILRGGTLAAGRAFSAAGVVWWNVTRVLLPVAGTNTS